MLTVELTKLYYSIGEVAEMFGVAPSVIRYWESEIPGLSPSKNSKGDRRYTPKDIQKLHEVFHLIKERGFTIDGAKRELDSIKAKEKEKNLIIKKLTDLKTNIIKFQKSLDEEL